MGSKLRKIEKGLMQGHTVTAFHSLQSGAHLKVVRRRIAINVTLMQLRSSAWGSVQRVRRVRACGRSRRSFAAGVAVGTGVCGVAPKNTPKTTFAASPRKVGGESLWFFYRVTLASGKSALLIPSYCLAGGERQESHFACVLDCGSNLTLLLRGQAGDATGTDLVAIRDE